MAREGVAAVRLIAQKRAQFAGEVLGGHAAPRDRAGYAEPGHADRGLRLVEPSRNDELRQSSPEQRDRCSYAAVVDGGLTAEADLGQPSGSGMSCPDPR
jgi:hypothetical protein